jgi:hypothetical protein
VSIDDITRIERWGIHPIAGAVHSITYADTKSPEKVHTAEGSWPDGSVECTQYEWETALATQTARYAAAVDGAREQVAQRESLRLSALGKLTALGLTPDEITALGL